MDLADRLDGAGVTAERAPTLDEGLDAVWPLAKQLAKLSTCAVASVRPRCSCADSRVADGIMVGCC
jgi:hypothetical protein